MRQDFWATMTILLWHFSHIYGVLGHPILPRSVGDPRELNIGDHILIEQTSSQYRKSFSSALVYEAVDKLALCPIVITNDYEAGVIVREIPTDKFQTCNIHRVEYSSCRYSGEESCKRAMSRINENDYNPLCNNSHHFVSWCKTGREYPLTDIVRTLGYQLDGKWIVL
jgi:hypothetical protein